MEGRGRWMRGGRRGFWMEDEVICAENACTLGR